VAAGLAAVFTFPLRHGADRLGALDLYRDTPGELTPRAMVAAQTLADVVAAYLLNAQSREAARVSSDRLAHHALHDPLTGLANRLLLEERLDHARRRATRSHTNAAVLFADLDRFKEVNDTHGHRIGDELLCAVAARLSALVRPGDTLARVSGDEFVFLCEDLHEPGDVMTLARRIDHAFAQPFQLTGLELSATVSVGMAFAGPGEDVSSDLVARADLAMYQVKRARTAGRRIVDLRESLQTDDDTTLERDLRQALAADQLEVAYQPIVRSADGLVTGVEALLRWTHPHRGPVPALAMVGVAEKSGLISAIGLWVLERSCRDHRRWAQDHPQAPLDLAVNVSAHQLISAGFAATVEAVLARTHMDPTTLILEMTENIVIEDSARAITVLADLKTLGVRLAIDDFGTGYSSLSYLSRLPVDIVKIDQSFIADIGLARRGGAIVTAVTHMAHALGLTVTAEGVETPAQQTAITRIGCESAQGYFYAHPMPAADSAAHLSAHPTTPPHLPASRHAMAPAP
jgi:diguanylate cyclase (GGDEF)-like protein